MSKANKPDCIQERMFKTNSLTLLMAFHCSAALMAVALYFAPNLMQTLPADQRLNGLAMLLGMLAVCWIYLVTVMYKMRKKLISPSYRLQYTRAAPFAESERLDPSTVFYGESDQQIRETAHAYHQDIQKGEDTREAGLFP